MGTNTGIEWAETRFFVRSENRWKTYRRKTGATGPGATERRKWAGRGFRWCRDCKGWLTADLVTKQAVCRPHANAEYRRNYAANPGPVRAQKYARRRNLGTIPAWWREDKFEEFQGQCAYGCGRTATTLDHVFPVKLGGRSIPTNLMPACIRCNAQKKANPPGPWIEKGLAAFPDQWSEIIALSCEHAADWEEAA